MSALTAKFNGSVKKSGNVRVLNSGSAGVNVIFTNTGGRILLLEIVARFYEPVSGNIARFYISHSAFDTPMFNLNVVESTISLQPESILENGDSIRYDLTYVSSVANMLMDVSYTYIEAIS